MESQTPQCPFCQPGTEPILRNEHAYACYDKYPVTPGHLLLVPWRHVGSYFDTTDEERTALLALLDEGKYVLDASNAPGGYNIGINVGEIAGQTIPHVHIHLIPRYPGDVERPRGGVRGVIPANQSY